MKIFLHDYGGYAFIADLARELARRGNEVHHASFAQSGSPGGVLHKRGNDPEILSFERLDIGAEFRKYSLLRRYLQENEYSRILLECIKHKGPDIVISSNASINIQSHLQQCCQQNGINFAFWVQDLHGPAMSAILGKGLPIFGKAVAAYFSKREIITARKSAACITICDGHRQYLISHGCKPDSTICIPNWAPIANIPHLPKDNPWSREEGIAGRFCFLYSGTLGLKHSPTLLLDLGRGLPEESDALVVVAANGEQADWLAREGRGLSRLRVLPLQSAERMPEVWASADVLLSILTPEATVYSVPSKVLSYLCAARPLLLAMPEDNPAARMVMENGAGLVASAGDSQDFLEKAKVLMADRDLRLRLGKNARHYAEQNFALSKIADRFATVFENITG